MTINIQDALSMLKSGDFLIMPTRRMADALKAKELQDSLVRTLEEHERVMKDAQWQPIETAPKDGTEILCLTRQGNQYVVAYDDIFSAPWRVFNDFGLNETVPTHWRSLQASPVIDAQITKEQV